MQAPATTGRGQLTCAWLGPSNGGLGWLHQQFATAELPGGRKVDLLYEPTINPQKLKSLANQGLDRLVIACSDRLSYPNSDIRWWLRNCPDIPLALATDQWWDGARRTGLGELDHLELPWYRWWDGWTDWLSGRRPELFGPSPRSLSIQPANRSPDFQPGNRSLGFQPGEEQVSQYYANSHDPLPHVLVVSNCRLMSDAWILNVQGAGAEASACSWPALSALDMANLEARIDWVLWDDSCLDTAAAEHSQVEQLAWDQLGWLQQQLPESRLLAAWSMPRAEIWMAAEAIGTTASFAKPSSGWAVSSCLNQI